MATIIIYSEDGKYRSAERSSSGDYTITGVVDNPVEGAGMTQTQPTRQFTKSDIAGDDTNVSLEEVYNQLILTCNLEELEDVVSSPTDDDDLYSPFTNKQLYATEYVSWGEGEDAYNGFREMVKKGTTQYNGASVTNWYVQVYKSKAWEFNGD